MSSGSPRGSKEPASPTSDPGAEVPKSDKGAETTERILYQHWYAAIVACGVLDDDSDVVEVYCEHHEDILVKHADGLYTGLQVKTRESHLPPFTASDEQIVDSLAKFCKLDKDYPQSFRRFVIGTNHSFFAERDTRENISHIIELAKQCGSSAIASKARPLVKARCERASVDDAGAIRTLRE